MGLQHKQEKTSITPCEKCPVCGGDLVQKQVDKLLSGGGNAPSMKVQAEVCLRCGEHLYDQETIRRFAQVRRKLERHDTAEFQLTGQSFRVE